MMKVFGGFTSSSGLNPYWYGGFGFSPRLLAFNLLENLLPVDRKILWGFDPEADMEAFNS